MCYYDAQDGKPPLEFRAMRIVAFSPASARSQTPPATPRGQSSITRVVTGVYLEGDVTVDQGDQLTVRAERIYYDFTSQRAIMLDATLATVDEVRNVPLYMRADEIRQLARGEFAAKKVTFSTSEFHTPHYHIGASEVYLHESSRRPPQLPSPGREQARRRPGRLSIWARGAGREKGPTHLRLPSQGRHHQRPGRPDLLLALPRRRHQQERNPPAHPPHLQLQAPTACAS